MGAAARRTTEQFLGALEATIVSPPPPRRPRPPPRARPGRVAEIVIAPRGGADTRVVVGSALAGFVLALIGVAVGRWTARH